jgi:hypothetical protein
VVEGGYLVSQMADVGMEDVIFAYAYDATMVIMNAIERIGTLRQVHR